MANRRFRLEIPADNNGITSGEITHGLIGVGRRIETGLAALSYGNVRTSGPDNKIIGTYSFVEDEPVDYEEHWDRLKTLVRQMSEWANDDDNSQRYHAALDVLALMKMLSEEK